MGGHHHHHHHDAAVGDRKVLAAIAVNVGLTAVQIVGGILAGSLALIADALHNFSDAISLVIAFGARKIARRPADPSMTFGYGRVEVVAALINYTSLIIIGLYLAYEAVARFADPPSVDGWLVVAVAFVALAVDTVTMLLTYALSRHSMNIRAAFLHNLADALGSLAVIVAGTLILLYDWRLIDPLVTLAIAGYILWQSAAGIGPVIRILMLGSPPDIDPQAVVATMRKVPGVQDVHHVHLWQMQEHENAVDAHLVIEDAAWPEADDIKRRTKQALERGFGITHSTLDIERFSHACTRVQTFGHADG